MELPRSGRLLHRARLRAGLAGFVPAAAAAILVALYGLAGIIALPWALLALALIALAYAFVRVQPAPRPQPQPAPLAPSVDAILGALAGQWPDPCLILDGGGRILFQNEPARMAMGVAEPGLPLTFVLRAPEVAEALGAVIGGAEAQSVTFFERVPAERWLEARIAPIASPALPEALPVRHVVTLRDLTEAQRVERMRADFIANASHELRTPLASLIGFIETLQGPAREDRAARERFLEIMAVQARRMSRLIDDLMSLSRIERKAHLRPSTVTDLAAIIEHVADAMGPLARDSGVEISIDIPERPLTVIGDQDELAQVVQNLVDNGVKYGRSGGRVEIMAARRGGGESGLPVVAVAVRDHGPGIAPEHLPRLTERFYRVDVSSSRDTGGTGLGLAIVKHILNRHRGRLTIESAPGKGATFTVTVEAAEPTGG